MTATVRFALLALCLMTGCAGKQRIPDWHADAYDALQNYRKYYFAGRSALAERELGQARAAIGRSARLDLAARVELFRCGVTTAALDFDACGQTDSRLMDAAEEDQAYAAFLSGDWVAAEPERLPPQYRDLIRAAGVEEQNKAARQIEDPVSRLVAAAVLLKLSRASPETVNVAVHTASSHGLRRPLLAWLMVQARLAEQANDSVFLEKIKRRIDLVAEPIQP